MIQNKWVFYTGFKRTYVNTLYSSIDFSGTTGQSTEQKKQKKVESNRIRNESEGVIGQEKSLIPQSTEVKDKRKGTELILVKLRSINTG